MMLVNRPMLELAIAGKALGTQPTFSIESSGNRGRVYGVPRRLIANGIAGQVIWAGLFFRLSGLEHPPLSNL